MNPSVKLSIELSIDKGRGYVPADENKNLNAELNTIAIDSIHTPITATIFPSSNHGVTWS